MAQAHDLTIVEHPAAVRCRELSPVEITEHYLERIKRLNQVDAYVTATPDTALAQVRKGERMALKASAPEALPPLLGVPIPMRDLNLVKDVPTTFGSAAYENFFPPLDDSLVERLRDAGTVLLGKTHASEFGLHCDTETDVGSPTRMPWDLGRSVGRSSSGAAAAIASGVAPAAQASDDARLIRTSAAMCGLFGIEPARGRVSGGPTIPDLFGLTTNGPLARTVSDAATLLHVMAHHRIGDLCYMYVPDPPAGSFATYANRKPRHLYIDRTTVSVVPDVKAHLDVLAVPSPPIGYFEDGAYPAETLERMRRFTPLFCNSEPHRPARGELAVALSQKRAADRRHAGLALGRRRNADLAVCPGGGCRLILERPPSSDVVTAHKGEAQRKCRHLPCG